MATRSGSGAVPWGIVGLTQPPPPSRTRQAEHLGTWPARRADVANAGHRSYGAVRGHPPARGAVPPGRRRRRGPWQPRHRARPTGPGRAGVSRAARRRVRGAGDGLENELGQLVASSSFGCKPGAISFGEPSVCFGQDGESGESTIGDLPDSLLPACNAPSSTTLRAPSDRPGTAADAAVGEGATAVVRIVAPTVGTDKTDKSLP